MIKLLIPFLLFLISLNAQAVSSKVGLLQIRKQKVVVYSEPSFDASIIATLKKGQKLYALKKKIIGLDGLGLFYKVRLKKKKFGYILDTAVKGFKPSRISKLSDKKSRSKKKSKKMIVKKKAYSNSPIPYAKSFGVVASQLNYALKTGGGSKKSNLMFYGLRLSGPGWKYSNFPFDVQLLYAPSSPKFFDQLVDEHSGSVLTLDLGIPFELKRGSWWSVYGSLSGVVSRYDFDLIDNGVSEESSKTELGFSLGLGGGVRRGLYLFKLDGKYIKLGSDSIGVNLSVQRQF